MAEAEAGEREIRGILTGLEPCEEDLERDQQGIRLPSQRRGCCRNQPTTGLSEQDHGPMVIASLAMEQGHRQLHHSLQPTPFGVVGLVPELLEQVMGSVPITPVEEGDGLLQARFSQGR
jgi:hypothetical protein